MLTAYRGSDSAGRRIARDEMSSSTSSGRRRIGGRVEVVDLMMLLDDLIDSNRRGTTYPTRENMVLALLSMDVKIFVCG
jgi:hypothetical protein